MSSRYPEVREVSLLGRNVRHLRLMGNMTQPELAAKAGVGKTVIANVEKGFSHDVRAQHVLALARALGLSMESLMTVDHTPPAGAEDLEAFWRHRRKGPTLSPAERAYYEELRGGT